MLELFNDTKRPKLLHLCNSFRRVKLRAVLKGYLSTEQAAERLEVSGSRIRQMILDGIIKGAEKVGANNVIPEKEIIRLKNMERKAGRPAKVKKDEKVKS